MWDDGTGTLFGVPHGPSKFEVSAPALGQQVLANLGGTTNDTVGKIERGGNGFNECFRCCVVAVKELME